MTHVSTSRRRRALAMLPERTMRTNNSLLVVERIAAKLCVVRLVLILLAFARVDLARVEALERLRRRRAPVDALEGRKPERAGRARLDRRVEFDRRLLALREWLHEGRHRRALGGRVERRRQAREALGIEEQAEDVRRLGLLTLALCAVNSRREKKTQGQWLGSSGRKSGASMANRKKAAKNTYLIERTRCDLDALPRAALGWHEEALWEFVELRVREVRHEDLNAASLERGANIRADRAGEALRKLVAFRHGLCRTQLICCTDRSRIQREERPPGSEPLAWF